MQLTRHYECAILVNLPEIPVLNDFDRSHNYLFGRYKYKRKLLKRGYEHEPIKDSIRFIFLLYLSQINNLFGS
jgi:hypothetical protein